MEKDDGKKTRRWISIWQNSILDIANAIDDLGCATLRTKSSYGRYGFDSTPPRRKESGG